MTRSPASVGGPYVVDLPGAFEIFFSGTGVVAGDPYSDDPDEQRGAEELKRAWESRKVVKRGKGHSDRLTLISPHAALVLAEYAETCITSNYGGEPDHTEVAAARLVLERVEQVTEGRVHYDGFSIYLDGRRTT